MAKAKLRKWDSTEHLKTDEDVANYLDAWLEEAGDDPQGDQRPGGEVARRSQR